MRKADLLKALLNSEANLKNLEPPERAVFFHDEELHKCCWILDKLVAKSWGEMAANRVAERLPIPNVDLPMIF